MQLSVQHFQVQFETSRIRFFFEIPLIFNDATTHVDSIVCWLRNFVPYIVHNKSVRTISIVRLMTIRIILIGPKYRGYFETKRFSKIERTFFFFLEKIRRYRRYNGRRVSAYVLRNKVVRKKLRVIRGRANGLLETR